MVLRDQQALDHGAAEVDQLLGRRPFRSTDRQLRRLLACMLDQPGHVERARDEGQSVRTGLEHLLHDTGKVGIGARLVGHQHGRAG